MEKLNFDSGIKEYEVNGNGILRFNPGDPNVYGRLLDAVDKIKAIEAEMLDKGKQYTVKDGTEIVRLMVDTDKKVKTILQEVFGRQNDFDEIFGSVSVMAVAMNGERVITNFITAITPIVTAGAEQCAKQKIQTAVNEAREARERRQK